MWITRQEYRDLIDGKARAEARAELLTVRLNQVEHALGQQVAAQTGRTQLVPRFETSRTAKPEDSEVSFEDVGDIDARRLGIADESAGFPVGVI